MLERTLRAAAAVWGAWCLACSGSARPVLAQSTACERTQVSLEVPRPFYFESEAVPLWVRTQGITSFPQVAALELGDGRRMPLTLTGPVTATSLTYRFAGTYGVRVQPAAAGCGPTQPIYLDVVPQQCGGAFGPCRIPGRVCHPWEDGGVVGGCLEPGE